MIRASEFRPPDCASFDAFCGCLAKNIFRSLGDSTRHLTAEYGQTYRIDAARHFTYLRDAFYPTSWPDEAVRAYVKFCKSILAEEAAFQKSGRYSATSFPEVQEAVYNNTSVMEGHYLSGLLISYFLWPHHYRLLQYFRHEFASTMENAQTCMEWGCGHGLLSQNFLDLHPDSRVTLCDISPASLSFAERWLLASGHSNCAFLPGDVLEKIFPPVNVIICGELLEHVANPAVLMDKIMSCLLPGGRAFVTGAINAPQVDHLSLFQSPDEVLELARKAGFRVVSHMVGSHPQRSKSSLTPTVVAMNLEKQQ